MQLQALSTALTQVGKLQLGPLPAGIHVAVLLCVLHLLHGAGLCAAQVSPVP